ncbi:hypothetical protein MHK_002666, partial [Candidatus Magnetomorum sp. HK-1]
IYCNESESCGGLYMDRQVLKQFDFIVQKQNIISSITVLNVLAGFIYPYEYSGIDILNDGKLSIQESIQILRSLMNIRYHSADYNPRDFQINLSEMLRIIQIYNLGGYHCDRKKKMDMPQVFWKTMRIYIVNIMMQIIVTKGSNQITKLIYMNCFESFNFIMRGV